MIILIIFFDEATSGLDKKNEQNIFKLLWKLIVWIHHKRRIRIRAKKYRIFLFIHHLIIFIIFECYSFLLFSGIKKKIPCLWRRDDCPSGVALFFIYFIAHAPVYAQAWHCPAGWPPRARLRSFMLYSFYFQLPVVTRPPAKTTSRLKGAHIFYQFILFCAVLWTLLGPSKYQLLSNF